MAGYLNLYEINHYAYERGLMEEDVWLAWRSAAFRDLQENPGLVELWGYARSSFGEGFQALVDELLSEG